MNFKRFVKDNRFLAPIAFFIRKIRNSFLMKRFSKYPINAKKVVFYRSGGGYGDNPCAVAEYLHLHYPELELVWVYGSQEDKRTIPEYIKPVKFESDDYLKNMATAGAWICSTLLPEGIIKRSGQLYIQTWHGDKGFKKFGNDAFDLKQVQIKKDKRVLIENSVCDFFFTGAKWFIPKIRSAVGFEGKVKACGLPRNDCLLNIDEGKVQKIKNNLSIKSNLKILIYAPTFRDHEKTHEVVTSTIDLPAIVKALEEKTGNSWLCLLKAHAGKNLKLSGNILDDKFIDVTGYPDIADLLMISDMLITDYSSCAGDFALTDNFILLYQDDIESYIKKDRTLYFKMEETPYFVAHNLNEAVKIINEVNDEMVKENCKAIRNFYDVCESGRATQEVAELILQNMKRLEEMQT